MSLVVAPQLDKKRGLWSDFVFQTTSVQNAGTKEIEMIHRLFLVIAMYCQASSSQFNKSLNLLCC